MIVKLIECKKKNATLVETFNIFRFVIPLILVIGDKSFYQSMQTRCLNFELFLRVVTNLIFNLQIVLEDNSEWQFLSSFVSSCWILAGCWSCRVYEPSARNSRRCWSTVGFYKWELLAHVCIFCHCHHLFFLFHNSNIHKQLLSHFQKTICYWLHEKL